MKATVREAAELAFRVVLGLGCVAGIWWSLKTVRADALYRAATPESVREAIRLIADEPSYYLLLGQLDHREERSGLEHAVRLNAYDAPGRLELAMELEGEGDTAGAERLLLEAYAVDRTYLQRWSLANFYLRRGDMAKFWYWAHMAAEMPSDDMHPLFQLCWRFQPDARFLANIFLTDNPSSARQFLSFLLEKDQLAGMFDAASRLLQRGDPQTDAPLLLDAINRLAAAGDAVHSNDLWRRLIAQRWVTADSQVPNNARFSRKPIPVVFDWNLPAPDGLNSRPGPSGLEVEFSGKQPEACTVAEQLVALAPGQYEFRSRYQTSDIAPGTGLRWQLIDDTSKALLAESPDLSSEGWRSDATTFPVADATHLVRLRLQYRRASGTPRISGQLQIVSTMIVIARNR